MIAQPKSKSPTRPKATAAKTESPPKPSGNRTALIKRMWRAADAQVQEIENRLLQESREPLERERDARMLAVLARTLRELSALDETKQRKQTAASADDEAVPRDFPRDFSRDFSRDFPRDMDELRRSLARKPETLIAEGTAALPRET